MFLIIEINYGFLGSMDLDMGCYSSFNIKNRQRQIVWTLLLASIFGRY